MTEKRIRLIYGILLSVALTAAAICLIVACLYIYNSGGEQIYTPEKVSDTFRYIAIPVYLAIALTVGGFILHFCLPNEKLRIKLGKNEPLILKNLHRKQDYTLCGDAKLRRAIYREQQTRNMLLRGGVILLGLGSVAFLIYGLQFDRYTLADPNSAVINGTLVLLACMAMPFGFGIFSAIYARDSIRREIKLMKLVAAPKAQNSLAVRVKKFPVQEIRLVLLCTAVICIVGGFLLDGWVDVLTKAINICTECVGLG